jgi:RNA polymerase sigma-70 factor (ECF subfamily)
MNRMITMAIRAAGLTEHTSDIARGLRRRNPDLIEALIERYQYRLFRYLMSLTGNREDASDMFQETWIRILERGRQYNGKWRFESWLFTVARNLVIDKIRRQRKSVSLEEVPGSMLEIPERDRTDEAPAVRALAQSETTERVRTAMQQLSPAFREALVLRFQEELPLDEIARITAAPLSTVKSRIYRGLEMLRDLMGEDKP